MIGPKVVVAIAAFNAQQFIAGCLSSLENQDYKNLEIYVVDNNSTDDTLNIIQKFNSVRLIKNKKNNGVCSVRNKIIESTESKYILTLDSDVVLEDSFISTIVREAEDSRHNIGMWGGTIIDMKNKESIDSLGIRLSRFWKFYDVGSGINISNLDKVSIANTLGPCACAGLYLRNMLESIREEPRFEAFDSSMHYLVEDFDVAIRAKNNGWGFKYIKGAKGYHYRHGSRVASKVIRYLSFRNRYYLIVKNLNLEALPYLILSIFFYDLPRIAYLTMIDFKIIKRSIFDLNNMLWKKN